MLVSRVELSLRTWVSTHIYSSRHPRGKLSGIVSAYYRYEELALGAL